MKNLLIIFFTFVTLISCQNTNEKDRITSENEKLVRQCFDYFNKHQWKEMAELYIDTAEFKDPSLGRGIVKQTRQQIVDKYSALNKMFPDIRDDIVQIYHSGEKNIIVEFVSSGTAPDNSKFELPICTIFTIENGKIVKDFTYYDNF
ncbi:nuclear transport factor 2 family protein [bacterium]|nr:nuclear transport factor 2 family protein [bacterium]